MMKQICKAILICVIGTFVGGCTSTTGPQIVFGPPRAAPGDILAIRLFTHHGERQVTAVVDSNGDLNLPPIGKVHAAGRGSTKIAEDIKTAFDQSDSPVERVIVRQAGK